MALFKVYHGDKDDLPEQLKDSYGYMVVDDDPGDINIGTWTPSGTTIPQSYGIGEWYIDAQAPNDVGKRYRIAAISLIDEDAQEGDQKFYTLEDLVRENSLTDDFVDAAWDSTQSTSKFSVEQQPLVRQSIDVAKKDDSISKAYTVSVDGMGWETDEEEATLKKKTVALTEALHCGSPSAILPIPPTVIYVSGPKDAYDAILKAELDSSTKQSITFYMAADDVEKITSSLSMTIVDYR